MKSLGRGLGSSTVDITGLIKHAYLDKHLADKPLGYLFNNRLYAGGGSCLRLAAPNPQVFTRITTMTDIACG